MNTTTNGRAFTPGNFLPPHVLPVTLQVVLLLGMGAFAALALFAGQYIIAGGLCVVSLVAVVLVKYPRAWLYSSVLLWAVWFRSSDRDVSALEVGMVAFYLGGLILWFIGSLVLRTKLIRNFADQLILVFFTLGVANVAIAWLNGVDLMLWLREFLLFVFILYYFPIKELITTRRHLVVFLSLAALVIFGLGVMNLQMYMQAANNAVYAFNILSSRVSLNETIFLGSALCSTVFLLHSRRWYSRAVFLALTVFYSTVLVASFTRGAWLTFIIGQIVIFFLVDNRRRLALATYLGLGAVSFIVAVVVFMPGMSDFIFHSIESRFSSSAKGTQDISVNARVLESEATIRGIYERPFSGAGMGARITFYDIIDRQTSSPAFLHNGYLFIAYKMGIPMALLFFLGILMYQAKGFLLAYRIRDPLYRCVAIGASASLLAALIISLTSNQFALRHGLSLIAVYIALIAIAEKLWREQQLQFSLQQSDKLPGTQSLLS